MPTDDPTSTVADEGLHPAGDDPDWQESAYLAWRDPLSGLGGNHRIGNEPNRQTANLWCGLYHQDGTRFRCNGEGLNQVLLDDETAGVFGVCAGPQRIFHDGWRLRYVLDGDGCRADLEITDEGERSFANAKTSRVPQGRPARSSPTTSTGLPPSRARWSSTVSKRKWSTPPPGGTTLGRATLGQLRLQPQLRWLTRVGDHALTSLRIDGRLNGSFFRIGALTRGGEKIPVLEASMLVHVDDDSLSCPSAEVRYELEDGKRRSSGSTPSGA